MIPSHELRIGNYFLLHNRLHQVSMVNGNGSAAVGYEEEGAVRTCPLAEALPVPLNDELLQQAGFRYHPYFQFWQKIEQVPGGLSELDIDRDYNVIDFMRRPIVKGIHSLHHLQNIFYALKGRELEVEF